MQTQFSNNFARAFGGIENFAARIVAETAADIRDEIIAQSFDQKTGAPGAIRRASASGESFAAQTGGFNRSIEIVQPDKLTAIVGSDLPQAPILEAADALNRPSFVPAARRVARKFGRKLNKL